MTTSRSDRGPLDVRPRDLAGLEARAVLLAAVAWAGVSLGPSGPALPVVVSPATLGVAAFTAGLGLVRRSWPILLVGVFLAGAHLGARADTAYVPLAAGPLDHEVTVVGDPRPVGAGWRVVVKLADGERVEATGYGPAGWDLADVSVGEVHRMSGRLRPPPSGAGWLRVRHIVGRASVDDLAFVRGPGLVSAVPERIRGLVVNGAAPFSERQRALYLGLVIGDDRFQPLGQQLNFRAAGLTHLLAVSGQNVAFVLVVAGPALRLMSRRPRLIATVAVLVVFAAITRMEPSVLRATASAVLAVWAASSGRERSGIIILAVAVTALVGIDPFLVDSVGFQLSIAASAGILVLGPAMAKRLPGPVWVVAPLATTLAAQLAVSPLLALYFGPVSVASVSANLLAGWAAAAVMVLGLTVGLVAGLVPGPVAAGLQLPTVILLEWLEWVAAVNGRAPVPKLGPLSLLAVTMAAVLAGPRSRSADPGVARSPALRVLLTGGALILLAAGYTGAPDGPARCGPDLTWYPDTGAGRSVLVVGPDAGARSIEACLDRGVRAVDVVVATGGGRHIAETVTAITEVMSAGIVRAPPQHRIVGAVRLLEPESVTAGAVTLRLRPAGDNRIEVDVQAEHELDGQAGSSPAG